MNSCESAHAPCGATYRDARVLVFGTGGGAMFAPQACRKEGARIVGYLDNDPAKQSTTFQERPVHAPEAVAAIEHDLVLVASTYYDEIRTQLLGLGVPEEKILRFPDGRFGKEVRPCHLHSLQITHTGKVYPCCIVGTWDGVYDNADKVIGHVRDADLLEKLAAFNAHCSCEQYRLRKARPGDAKQYGTLFLELSLACQADCAMCFVHAPEADGAYDLYDALPRLIEHCRPREVSVQGGEVLIQKKSLRFVEAMRERFPETTWAVITNGSVDETLLPTVSRLFQRVAISICGFTPTTYKAVMDLDFERTIRFAEALCRDEATEVNLKYLVTPVNMQETASFLEWALAQRPALIKLIAANRIRDYLNLTTHDRFWEKIIQRSAADLARVFAEREAELHASGQRIYFSPEAKNLFGLDMPVALSCVTDTWGDAS